MLPEPISCQPYENLSNQSLGSVVGRARNVLEQGWARSGEAPVSLAGPLPWDDDADERRSWNFRLHCWDMLNDLLLAYSKTGDHAFLTPALRVAMEWIERHGASAPPRQSKFAWYDMAVGLRAQRLAFIIDAARASDSLDEESSTRLWSSLLQHRDYLADDANIKFHNNHGFYQAVGQMAMGRRFGAGDASMQAAFEQGQARVIRMLDAQFTTEGIHREHSPDYHRMVYDTLKGMFDAGFIIDSEVRQRAKRIEANLAWFIMPNGRLLNFGDTDRRTMLRPVLEAQSKWMTGQMRFAASMGRVGVAPEPGIGVFPASGYFFVRDAWPQEGEATAQHFYLAQNAAFHSRTHKHADNLSIVWSDHGCDILVDAGRFGYLGKTEAGSALWNDGFWYGDPRRVYCESTRAHNTVEIDKKNHPRRGVKPYGSALGRYGETAGLIYCESEVKLFRSIRFSRTLVYRPRHWLLIVDWLHDNLDAVHDYRQWHHLAPELELVRRESGYATTLPAGEQLQIISLLGDASPGEMCKGQEQPELQGFHSPGEHMMVPNWAACFEQQARTASFATLLAFGDRIEPDPDWSKIDRSGRQGRLRWHVDGEPHTIVLSRPAEDALSLSYEY